MAFIFTNPNPSRKLTGDCVIRAISLTEGKDWEQTYLELILEGYMMHDIPSSNDVWSSYLSHKGFKRYIIPGNCPNCYTIREFVQDYPKGTYILATGTHVVAVKDGNYFDTWDSGDEVPIYYWKKEI